MALFILVTHGKSYYLAGAYPTMFALGAAACTRLPRWLVALWAVLVAANGAFSLPLVLPVLPPDRLETMMDDMHPRPRPIEAAGVGAPLMQMLSDEFGWQELARDVEDAYARAAAGRSRKGRDFCLELRRSSRDRFLRLWTAAGAQRQQQLLSVGTARLRRFGRARRQRRSRAMVENLRFGARRRTFGTSPYAMPYERDRPDRFMPRHASAAAAALADVQTLRHRESGPLYAVGVSGPQMDRYRHVEMASWLTADRRHTCRAAGGPRRRSVAAGGQRRDLRSIRIAKAA